MKTKKLFLALLIMVSAVAAAFGNDGPDLTVVPLKASGVFKVIYKGNTAGKVKLNIFDSQGKIIHSDNITGKNGFICPLNFRGLPSGSYTIEVVDEFGRYREEVVYEPSADLKSIHVSRVIDTDNKFLLSVANARNEVVRVKIFDIHQRLLFSESKVLNGDFAQVYRMTPAMNHYTFEVSDAAGNRRSFTF